jgi:hypothetical protein
VRRIEEFRQEQKLTRIMSTRRDSVELDTASLLNAWRQLEKMLIEANKHYLMHADGGRAAVYQQISAIIQFITTVAPRQKLLHMPLLALQLALHYLDCGMVEPMLSPRTSGRGRRHQQLLIKIRSAVAMSLLCDIGYERKDAAKQVVVELTKLGLKTTPRALADWRDSFKKRPASDDAGETYRTMLNTENEFIGRRRGAIPDEKARAGLRHKILGSFTNFVLLAHLTSHPDLSKVIRKLKKGPKALESTSDSEKRPF